MTLPLVKYPWDGPDNLFWDDLRFPAQGISLLGVTSPPTTDTTGLPGSLLFADAALNSICGIAQMPHSWAEGTEIRPHIHWTKTSAAAGDVVWRFTYAIANVGDVFPAYSALDTATVAVSTADTDKLQGLSTFAPIDMTDKRVSCIIMWALLRAGTDGADTYAAAARLLEFDIHYQINRFGSPDEFPSHA